MIHIVINGLLIEAESISAAHCSVDVIPAEQVQREYYYPGEKTLKEEEVVNMLLKMISKRIEKK